jgi:transcriptional regulator with XRE-family HTH domain
MDDQKKAITLATAQQIRHFRQSKGMSQEALALKAELNPAYLGQLERGLKCPTIDTLYRIAQALDLSLSELFSFDRRSAASENRLGRMENALRYLPNDKADYILKVMEGMAAFFQK